MGAICRDCAKTKHLKQIIKDHDESLDCSHCGLAKRPAISAEALAAVIEPILREHFIPGGFDDGIQDGDSLVELVSIVVEQDLEFVDEVVAEIIELDPADPRDGDEPLWEEYAYYVETKATSWELYGQWSSALDELKHSRRFFSPRAKKLFSSLFSDVESLKYWENNESGGIGWKSVVFDLPVGTVLFRARNCNSPTQRSTFFGDPLRELGPPPPEAARSGRMNAEGVPVLYCALEVDTALAEMRPAIGMELVVAGFQIIEPLRVLDFSLLEKARGNALSYLQPDFINQVERNHFLRRLHRLITQPVVPGREADYLITQTMAEYLSHVAQPPLRGILFRSAQHENGTNVVLFSDIEHVGQDIHEAFPIVYIDQSLSVHHVESVSYSHTKLSSFVNNNGEVSVYNPDQGDDFDDDLF